jgi:hypothetical protein
MTDVDFTKEQLSAALVEVGALARDQGKVIDIAVYGGSCLMLVSNFRVATKDVDAVAATDQPFVDAIARVVADRHGWPHDWLNDGVRTYLSPKSEGKREPMNRPSTLAEVARRVNAGSQSFGLRCGNSSIRST